MIETIYKCDVCRMNKEKDDIVPYFVNANSNITIMDNETPKENTDKHICINCISIICQYKKDEIEKQNKRGE